MAALFKSMCAALIAAVLVAAVMPPTEAAISCSAVTRDLAPCIPYLTSNAPLGQCCGGVKSLNNAATSTPDRKAVCSCLKNLATSYRNANLGKAAGLPKQCGVKIPYEISPSIDCSTVK